MERKQPSFSKSLIIPPIRDAQHFLCKRRFLEEEGARSVPPRSGKCWRQPVPPPAFPPLLPLLSHLLTEHREPWAGAAPAPRGPTEPHPESRSAPAPAHYIGMNHSLTSAFLSVRFLILWAVSAGLLNPDVCKMQLQHTESHKERRWWQGLGHVVHFS